MDPITSLQIKRLSNERQKLVHAGAPLVLLFLILRLKDLPRCCLKLFEILPLLITYTRLFDPKTRTFEKFGMN